jgi:regulator of protease activity HflC (stomatin/prohibitin superfamily)
MAEIRNYGIMRHMRSEPSAHILRFQSGKMVASQSGPSFWFHPLSTALAEVPLDDREQPFLFTGRTLDFQDAAVQGTLTYRVADPERLAKRIDFSIDLDKGLYLHKPLGQLADLVTQFAQGFALEYLNQTPLHQALQEGLKEIRGRIETDLRSSSELEALGINLVAVRLTKISPSSEMEKALQAPTRESIQQQADQASFERRALAVEKERAIAENELQNKIELTRREETLIKQNGLNERRRATDEVETRKVETKAAADRLKVQRQAEAEGIDMLQDARNRAEKQRMDIYRDLPTGVLIGLAARELAGKLERIDHLNLAPESLSPLLTSLMTAGRRRLEGEE